MPITSIGLKKYIAHNWNDFIMWSNPQSISFTLNTNGACSMDNKMAGIGAMIRNIDRMAIGFSRVANFTLDVDLEVCHPFTK